MCGITGAIWLDPAARIDDDALRRMTAALVHRGPDDEGFHRREFREQPPYPSIPGVALGHRRLAIIDREGSRQPLANEAGDIWLVFNGEIYNFADLHRRLQGSGHVFRTQGDTETIVHLYEDEGLDFVKHLHGMFALALWDEPRRRLVLARDRLGKKPLVYRQERDRLLFASELKSLLAAPGVAREVDPSAIDEYLTYGYVPHPNSIFQGTRKLPPGHYAVLEEGVLSVVPYWLPDFNREIDRPVADYVDELRTRADAAVQVRMRSDVPLGAFLSGGVDSSLVVALMQRHAAEPVKTFSIGFARPEFDETAYARQVAEHLKTDHRAFLVEPQALELLPQLVWHYDEPFADSSAIPTFCLSQHTRRHVTVALTGDAGDELFGGYDRYRAVQIGSYFDRLPQLLRAPLTTKLWQRLPQGGKQRGLLRRWKRLTDALGADPIRRYAQWVCIFHESRRAELYSEEFLARLPNSDPLDFLAAAFDRSRDRDPLTQAMLGDLLTYLPCDLMTKTDIASMAVGLECRMPWLDHRVVELAAAMPAKLKFRFGRGKAILRRAFADLIPSSIFRRGKMGFGVPLEHWFRHELKDHVQSVLGDARTAARGYFRPAAVEKLLAEHFSGRFNHAPRIWSLLMLELWHRQWIDGDQSPANPGIMTASRGE